MTRRTQTRYARFLDARRHAEKGDGLEAAPDDLPRALFPFQRDLVRWALKSKRGAVFADCGLGKTAVQLAWSDLVSKHERKPVLILTPLAVGVQTLFEADKFGIGGCARSRSGEVPDGARIVITNYESLHHFRPEDFCGVVCDESSILKNYSGARRAEITEFMRALQWRLLCTATAAPNDYVELGTSAEALGEMGHMDMLARFFKNEQNTVNPNRHFGEGGKWRFRGHAEDPFWRWVCSWARALRRPSDIGQYDDSGFTLPELQVVEHIVKARTRQPGTLFDLPARNWREEREEVRRTIRERCERAAELANHDEQVIVWCHLNDEGDLLESMIDGAQQVAGRDSDDEKEARLAAFAAGDLRALVTKPKIGAWGLNLQRCAHVVYFPSHSYEQYYQAVRRCWRFGQERTVQVDIVLTEGQKGIRSNMERKAEQAADMFDRLVGHMREAEGIRIGEYFSRGTEVPVWL